MSFPPIDRPRAPPFSLLSSLFNKIRSKGIVGYCICCASLNILLPSVFKAPPHCVMAPQEAFTIRHAVREGNCLQLLFTLQSLMVPRCPSHPPTHSRACRIRERTRRSRSYRSISSFNPSIRSLKSCVSFQHYSVYRGFRICDTTRTGYPFI